MSENTPQGPRSSGEVATFIMGVALPVLSAGILINEVYQSYFPPDRRPARTTIGVTALAVGALVEIDMIARRPQEGS